ncbi:WhiB family transcriptional regulator [Mycobacteroides immunogenum]|uniref:4Fe-4S Wbl-type domain-containing protein n=1 Tax=Mycobacteroides immunogenum TaxID=83262 RepID=A0A7V8RXA5_9MYCO|nr:WhiB family transcriptional regulator [Mycobacteroides immunogenum]KPG13703.1 hypothetical protein AN909_05405 [Mycobacteroides immunogenum]KPG14308.1 hypothetical protein AN908_07000 [Mycobacteroides immunogenum]KPG14376.1 hypothetical protein AN908_07455 [Mycobacteroides immunogenum]KPG17417.1 hypothetical protein AN910_04630 [Mycobacteroides immunogenum]KPG23999.1 hypothetical protein AN911_00530 [Mycobacteroides immunogenum]
MIESMDWQQYASCRGLGVEFFFPERGSGVSRQVRRICGRCYVKDECLAFSLKEGGFERGVWGGVGERIREREMYFEAAS